MTRSWLKRLFPMSRTVRRAPAAGRSLRFVQLEDRITPAQFYVDPDFTGAPGTLVNFNSPGGPNEKIGAKIGTDAFATIAEALTAANASPGADQIFLSIDKHNVDPSGGTLVVTDTVAIIGSGSKGETLVQVTGDTKFDIGSGGAVFRAEGAGTKFDVLDLMFDGGGKTGGTKLDSEVVGSAFRFEAGTAGVINNVQIANVIADSLTINLGFGVVANGPGTNVFVTQSTFKNIGREGVRYDTFASGGVSGNIFAGRLAPTVFVQYGVAVTEGASNVQILGNAFFGYSAGLTPGSAAILVADDLTFSGDGDADLANESATAVVVGNSIKANEIGIAIGQDDTLDDSDAFVRFNTISDNAQFGITTFTTQVTDALRNFWGDASGPKAPDNPGGKGNEVDIQVSYKLGGLAPNNGILLTPPAVFAPAFQGGGTLDAVGANAAKAYVAAGAFDFTAFFVDPAFTTNGAVVTFSNGGPGQPAIVGEDAFATIADALAVTNTNPGLDQVLLSASTHAVDPSKATIAVTDGVQLIGAGKASTTILVTGDTQASSGTNGAVIRADGVQLDIVGLTFDGDGENGRLVGSAFRYEGGTGTVSNVTIQDVIDDSNPGINFGIGVVAIDKGASVAVTGSEFKNIGREGVRFDTFATGSVSGSTFTGRALSPTVFVQYGVAVTEGAANVQITGSTFTGYVGSDPGSAGILIADDLAFSGDGDGDKANEAASAVLVGNTISANEVGVAIGQDAALDDSDAFINFNNIAGNTVGVSTFTTSSINGLRNWWGDPSGPTSPDNPGGTGDEADTKVVFTQFDLNPNDGILIKTAPVASVPVQAGATLDAIGAAVAGQYVIITGFDLVNPVPVFAAVPGGTLPATVNFTATATVLVQFGEALRTDEPTLLFDAADLTVGGSAPGAKVESVTPTANPGEFQVVVSATGAGTITLALDARLVQDATGNFNKAAAATAVAIATSTQIYVDPDFTGAPGTKVDFNVGGPNEAKNLEIGVNAFATIAEALATANAAIGPNLIFLSINDTHNVDPSGGTLAITDGVQLIGSGQDVTTIQVTGDTVAASGKDGAVFRADGVGFLVRDLTFDGGGKTGGTALDSEVVGSAFRFEDAAGSVSNVLIRDVIVDSVPGINLGFGVVAIGAASKVSVIDSTFENIGREGIRFDTFATGVVSGSSFTGRTGLTVLVQYGVSVIEGAANVQITGNTFTGYTGLTPGSAAINIADDLGFSGDGDGDLANEAATAVVVGNSITGNEIGITIGQDAALDDSDAFIRFNTIANNTDFGITTFTTQTIDALRNWWGDATGPLATGNATTAGDNPGGKGNEVDTQVLYKMVLPQPNPFDPNAPLFNPNDGILIKAPPVTTVPPQGGATVDVLGAAVEAKYIQITGFDLVNPVPTFAAVSGTLPTPFSAAQAIVLIRFGEAVTGFTANDLTVGGTAPGAKVVSVSPTANPGEFQVVVTATGEGTITLALASRTAQDLTGNFNKAAATTVVALVDRTAPTVTITSNDGKAFPGKFTDPFTVKVNFSESVVGFDKSDVVITGTAKGGSVVSITPDAANKVFTVVLGGFTTPGDIVLTIPASAAADAAGNKSGPAGPVLVADGTAPTVTITSPDGPLPVRLTDPITITVTASETVVGFDKADVILGGTQQGGTVQSVTPAGDGKTFSVTIGGFTKTGDLTVAIAPGGFTDAVGNPTPGLPAVFVADGTIPTVTVSSPDGPLPRPFSDPLVVTFTFSEPVTGFDATDVQIGGSAQGGSVTGFTPDAANQVFTVTLGGFTAKGDVTVALAAGSVTDKVGNPIDAFSAVLVADGTSPTITIGSPDGPLPRPFADPLTITFTFSESVTGFDKTDIVIAGTQKGGTVQSLTADAANKVFTATIGGFTTKGDVTVTVAAGAAADAAGNPSAAAGPITVAIADVTPPTATIGIPGVQLPIPFNDPISFNVTFSETVTGFDAADVVIGGTAKGGQVLSVTPGSDGKTFTVSVGQFSDPGDVTITIPAGAVIDAAQNASLQAGPVLVATADVVNPTVTIAPVNGPFSDPLTVTVTFSESVTGFTAADVQLSGTAAGGTVQSVTPDAQNKVFTVVLGGFDNPGSVIVTIPAGSANDAAGNGNDQGGPTTVAVSPDTTNPTPTITSPAGALPVTFTSTLTLTVTFDEAVTAFTAADVQLGGTAAGGTVQTFTPAADGKTFTVVLGGFTTPGSVTVTLPAGAANDLAGNPSNPAAVTAGNFVAATFTSGFSAGGGEGLSQPFFQVDGPTQKAGKSITPFEAGFTGGVRVGTADVNGDGVLDTIVGPGPGRVNEVRVYDGANFGKVLFSFNPFETTFTGGVFVHGVDLNGDGKAEVVVSPDVTGGPRVRILDGADAAAGKATTIFDFFGIDDPDFRGGARVGSGDLNGDGVRDLFVAAGFQGGPRVAIYDGKFIAQGKATKLVGDFFGYESTLRNGVFIAGGDINGDGFDEIILGAGPSGGPRVRVLDGKAMLTNNSQIEVLNFFAYDSNNRGGVRVAASDLDGDGVTDIVTAPGLTGGSTIRVFPNDGGSPTSLNLFGDFNDGVYVG